MILAAILLLAFADERHVAPTGDDAASGGAAAPWRTIQKAARSAQPGDTVLVHAGAYRERVNVEVSGKPGAPVVFRPAGDGPVRLSGEGLDVPSDRPALLFVENQSHLVFEDFELADFRTSDPKRHPCGVRLEGAGRDVVLRRLRVHRIRQDAKTPGGAHGIAVYGSQGDAPWSGVVVDGCEVADCRLGFSEALAVNGNVERFEIVRCLVRDCDNIGIDVIGLEKTALADDQPRLGRIAENRVRGISSFGNPAYGKERCAAGIYVDGARDLVVERNRVERCDFGLEVGCENPGVASGIVVRSNLLERNHGPGLLFGGYDERRGVVERCSFHHNTLRENDAGGSGDGEIFVQKARKNRVHSNHLVPRAGGALFTGRVRDNVLDFNVVGAGEVDAGDPAYAPAPGELDVEGRPRKAGARCDAGAFENPR
jgi:hypothetical protein